MIRKRIKKTFMNEPLPKPNENELERFALKEEGNVSPQ